VLTRDGVAGLICLAGSATLLVMSRGLPQPALVPIGPGFYPRILLAATALISAALVVSDLLAARRGRRAAVTAPVGYRLVVITFAVFTAYVVLMPALGFRLATFLFVTGLQGALDPPRGLRAWALVLAVAVATTAVTYYAFEIYLHVLLPRGRLTAF
jgi:hypothetical protein